MPFSIDILQQTQSLVMIALLVVLLAWEQINPFYNFFSRSVKRKGKHDLRNLFVGLVNALLVSGVFVALWAMGSDWSYEERFGLLHRFELGTVAHFIMAVLLLDLWMYIWHRMNHEIRFFWRFHRVHHSDPHMDVTTASRFHVGEIFFSSLFRIPLIILLGIWVGELLLYETIAFAVVQLHHSDVGLPPTLDRMLRGVIVSPFMHKIHHSRWRPETDSNYGSLFSFWDRIARTFRMRDLQGFKTLRIGLDEFDDPKYETVKNIFRLPLLKIQREEEEQKPEKQQQ
ncbi:MAG: sterol desaturase family protein [Balneolaceae bacterium]|nr:sterol desaturase family protein [Balneolaceae bacterium]